MPSRSGIDLTRLSSLKVVGLICGIVMLIVLWTFFAPTKIGGSTTYTITDGVSMQPLLHKDDLALIRDQSLYQIGDVVLYQNQNIHRPVLHRILSIQNGNYYFKGDNNNFDDPGYASRSQVTGKLWVHVPEAGAALGWFGKPLHASIIAACLVMTYVLVGLQTTERKDRNPDKESSHDTPSIS
jgi:signal peptidase I